MAERLKMLPIEQYVDAVNSEDPIRLYNYPIIGEILKDALSYVYQSCVAATGSLK